MACFEYKIPNYTVTACRDDDGRFAKHLGGRRRKGCGKITIGSHWRRICKRGGKGKPKTQRGQFTSG